MFSICTIMPSPRVPRERGNRANNFSREFQEFIESKGVWGSNLPTVTKKPLARAPRTNSLQTNLRSGNQSDTFPWWERAPVPLPAGANTRKKAVKETNIIQKAMQRAKSAQLIQSASRRRLSKLQGWIASQRKYMQKYLRKMEMSNIYNWTTQSAGAISKTLLPYIHAAPRTPRNIQGFLYKKVVLRNGNELKLNFDRATSWSLNPLFAASFKISLSSSNVRHILLRLPLNTPAPKLYIGDTSPLLNSSIKSALSRRNSIVSEEAEVILAPVDLEVVQRRSKPLGHITGISKNGESRKRLSIAASALLYGLAGTNRPQKVSKGMQAQEVDIEVVDVREKVKKSPRAKSKFLTTLS